MISHICIEYKEFTNDEWKLYRYVVVGPEESGTSEILLLRRAFGKFFQFRAVVLITEPVTLKIYDRAEHKWKEIK